MTEPGTGRPTVRRASVEVLRIFDAAYGIDLAEVERILQGRALDQPTPRRMEEDYTAVTVRELEPPLPAAELLRSVDLVPLLTHESRPMAEAARRDVLRHAHSYYLDDLVVLTWDRAFILEPWEDDDVADVLEVANAQLLEVAIVVLILFEIVWALAGG